MKCKSGKHEWLDPVSAERCCSGKWRREVRLAEDAGDLDPQGRTTGTNGLFVHGWVRIGSGPTNGTQETLL